MKLLSRPKALLGMVLTLAVFWSGAPTVMAEPSAEWVEKGRAYVRSGDYNSALFAYGEAIKADSQNAAPYFYRAKLYQDIKHHIPLAIADYTKAISLDAGMTDAYYERGLLYGADGKSASSTEDFSRVLAIDPQRLEAHLYRGFAYIDLKNYNEAEEDFTAYLETDPHSEKALSGRGMCSIELKKYEQAIEDYTRVLAINDKRPDYFVNRGHVFGLRGDYQKALSDAQAAIALDADSDGGQFNCAQALEGLGKRVEALEHYRKAIKLLPKDAKKELEKAQDRLNGKWDTYKEWL